MTMTSARWLALSLTTLVLSCTEDPGSESDTGSSTTEASTGGSGDPTATSSTTMDPSTGNDSSSGGSTTTSADSTTGALCEELPDDMGIAPTDVLVTNDGIEAIILVGARDCPGEPGRYTIIDPLQPGVDAVHPNPSGCGNTCQDENCGCPAVCNDAAWVRIEPGGSYTVAWSGAVYTPEEVEPECLGRGCPSECFVEITPPRGAYLVELQAMSLDQCSGNCDCAPSPEGSCELAPDTNLLANLSASIETALPSIAPLEISFGK